MASPREASVVPRKVDIMNTLPKAFTLASALLLSGLAPSSGSAAEVRCKSDPTVLLSDGTAIDLTADIGVPLWNVTSVEWVIHVPAGQRVVAVITTPNWPSTKEKFTIYADAKPGCVTTTTRVCTTTSTDVVAQLLVNTSLAFQSGVSGKPIPLNYD